MTLTTRLEHVLSQRLPLLERDETYVSYKKYYDEMKSSGLLKEEGYTLAPFGEPVSQHPQKDKVAARTLY